MSTISRRISIGRTMPIRVVLLLIPLLLDARLTTGLRHSSPVKRNSPASATPERNNMVRGLYAPAVVDPRSPELLLRCEYDLGGNELYAVNWFRNEDVLFRYSPSLVPKATAYQGVADVNVSLERSNATQLLLVGHQDVQRNMKSYEGTYVCEVSTERPFLTDYGVANVSAAILPKANPVLEGLRHNYQVGEFLELACTSAPSLPPAELTFYLNGRKIDRSRVRSEKMRPPQSSTELTSSSRSVLSLKLERQHFQNGSLKVACVARMANLTQLGRDYRVEAVVALGAANQPLAQEPPNSPSASSCDWIRASSWLQLVFFVVAFSSLYEIA